MLYKAIPSAGSLFPIPQLATSLFPIPQLTRESPFRTPPPDGHTEESYDILLHLNSKWPTSRSMKELLRLMKNKVKGKILWCGKYPRDREHQYHSVGTLDRFRLQCCMCKHALSESEARNYFALLIHRGAVPPSAVGLPSQSTSTEGSQASASPSLASSPSSSPLS
ncbi:hypothetical protein AYX13_06963 [Cryptococcus neoformans]|nr:hypothetical protein AYX13_06963 [Cryptococcus neoformans var. grubii]